MSHMLRNTIIALMILGAGIFIIQRLGEGFLKQSGLPVEINKFADLINGMRGLTNLILMGIAALVVLLIIAGIIRKIQNRSANKFKEPKMPEMPKELRLEEDEESEEPPAEEEYEESEDERRR